MMFNISEKLKTGSHWTWDTNTNGKPIITVDFDHTLTTLCGVCANNDDCGEVQPLAKEVLTELSKDYQIWVFSGRTQQEDRKIIKDFMEKHGLPYDEIILGKPYACFMIDDRAIHHVGWKETMAEIKERTKGSD